MKIAFWGESGQSNAGIHMRAVVSVFSALYPEIETAMYTMDTRKQSLCRKKPTGKSPVSGALSEPGADAACGVPGKKTTVSEKLCFIDCGSGHDSKKYRILRQAEIVVVNLRQEEKELSHFFLEEAHLLPKSRILLGNYCSQSRFNKQYLEQIYRAKPGQIMVLSGNTEFDYAYACGRAASFLRKESRMPGSLRNQLFLAELKKISEALLRDIGMVCGSILPETEHK